MAKFDECSVKTVQRCGRNVMDKISEKGDLIIFAVQIECCSWKEKGLMEMVNHLEQIGMEQPN